MKKTRKKGEEKKKTFDVRENMIFFYNHVNNHVNKSASCFDFSMMRKIEKKKKIDRIECSGGAGFTKKCVIWGL